MRVKLNYSDQDCSLVKFKAWEDWITAYKQGYCHDRDENVAGSADFVVCTLPWEWKKLS